MTLNAQIKNAVKIVINFLSSSFQSEETQKSSSPKMGAFIFAIILFFIALFSRVSVHAWNFTALLAAGLAFQFLFSRSKIMSYLIVLAALFVSDLALGHTPQIYSVYLSFVLALSMTQFFSAQSQWGRIGSTLFSSLTFFIASNLSVWAFDRLYSQDLNGLIQCFINAVPFYKNQFLADMVLTPAFVLVGSAILKSEAFKVFRKA